MSVGLSPTTILIAGWLVVLLVFDVYALVRSRRRKMRKW